jgi:hypothetical protein
VGNLRHNIEACVPSRTTSPLLLLIASLIRRKALSPPALAYDAHSAAGRPAGMTAGLAPVGTNGTPSTLEGYAPPASINGLRRNASRVRGGRRIQTGMRSNLLILALKCSPRDRGGGTSSESEACLRIRLGSKPRNAAKAETTSYARAFRRAVESQPRGRSASAVGCLELRTFPVAAQSRQ